MAQITVLAYRNYSEDNRGVLTTTVCPFNAGLATYKMSRQLWFSGLSLSLLSIDSY